MTQAYPDFGETLHKHGFKATPGRIRLLFILWSAKRPLTVEEIKKRARDINLVTLYRALEGLADKGVVYRGVGPVMKYELAEARHHHHLVCVECGFTRQCATC